jgi:hypothetical protein
LPSPVDIAVVVLFSVWATLSVLSQFRPAWLQRLKSKDLLHLIPNWRFFAPRPARRDYHLEYRLRDRTSGLGRWARVRIIHPRTLRCAVWHPEKRRRKTFNTLIRRLMRVSVDRGPQQAGRSISYLTLLNFVQRRHAPAGHQVQFRIVTAQDFCPARPVRLAFTSDWHAPAAAVRLEAAE